MSIDFKTKDFFYPFSILKFRNFLEKSQWFPLEKLIAYQENRLQEIINHAYEQVPYYRNLFDKLKLKPSDIKVLDDLQKLPLLTKKDLKNNFNELQAKNMRKFNPKLVYTSGTSGDRLGVFVDKPSNILEFSYYWRHWSWAGYCLGDRFAEFSSSFFMKQKEELSNSLFYFSKLSNRLLLNSLSISKDNLESYVEILKKYKPSFLKGLPSVLFYFSKFLKEKEVSDLKFKAIFSQGEILLDSHKRFIEETFNCRVYNSYGHMERTVAICECPYGGMHINPEYGVFERVDNMSSGKGYAGKVVGTSLHNFSMPLIRYEVGDYVEIEKEIQCSCGREMPLVSKIHGRKEDVIVTKDGKVITTLFIVFNNVPGIEIGQIIQDDFDNLTIRIAVDNKYNKASEDVLLNYVRKFVGKDMKLTIDQTSREKIKDGFGDKFRVVVSKVDNSL